MLTPYPYSYVDRREPQSSSSLAGLGCEDSTPQCLGTTLEFANPSPSRIALRYLISVQPVSGELLFRAIESMGLRV